MNSFTFFGITFYWYGIILGTAIASAMLLVERQADRVDRRLRSAAVSRYFKNYALSLLLPSLLGARLWHVMTDFQLYQNDWLAVLAVWNGGLSIIGALITGAVICILTARRHFHGSRKSWRYVTDTVVFGVPVGQIIGRFGNLINQELYGVPTNLPWGMHVDGSIQKYHPLFAYEALLLAAFAVTLYAVDRKKPYLIGSGWYTLAYVCYYAAVRFLLDFIRADRPVIFGGLGLNQLVLLGLLLCAAFSWRIVTMNQAENTQRSVIRP